MPSYDERKEIIRDTVLKRLGRMFRADGRTAAIMEEMGKAITQRLPSDYDRAAVEAVCEELGSRVISSHKYATWPSVAEVAQHCGEIVKDRQSDEAGGGAKPEPMTPQKAAIIWRDRAQMLRTYGAYGLLEAEGPAWVLDIVIDENGNESRRKRICRTAEALRMTQDLAAHYETVAYGDPREVGALDWEAWPHETRRWRNGSKDDWTLEGARARIRRCDEMIAADPGNPIWVHLRGIAAKAEQRQVGDVG